MISKRLTRRELLRSTAVAAAGTALAACQPAAAPAMPEEEVSEEVIEQVTEVVVEEAAAECEMDWNPTLPPVPKKYDPPVEVYSSFTTTPEWQGDDGLTNNPLYNRLVDNMGVVFKPAWEASGSAHTQRMNAAIAANELPDSFSASGSMRDRLVLDGALEDIKDIWEATASPLSVDKKHYPNHPWWRPVLKGDQLFGIPYINGPGYNVDNIGLIRQDWLDEVGLGIPETLDELEATMRALVEAGIATYGINCGPNLVTWHNSLDPVFGAFGVMPTIWVKGGDSQLEYGSTFAGVKDGLAVIRQWYADGLIDPDYYTYSYSDNKANLFTGKTGVTFSPWWYIRQAILQAEAQNPGAHFALMEAPLGPNGQRGRKASGIIGPHVCFKKGVDPVKVEAVINQLNWNMEIHVNFDKYHQYGELWDLVEMVFEEGYAWEWDENCELKVGPAATTTWYTQGWMGGFWFQQLCYDNYLFDVGRKIDPWFDQDPSTLNKAQRFVINDPAVKRSWDMYKFAVERLDQQHSDEFIGAPTPTMTELVPQLSKLESEYFTGIVVGNKPVEAFDEFVELWWSEGGDQVTADVNEWYASLED